MKTKRLSPILPIALAATIALGGCASTEDGRLAQAQGSGIGALLGGGLGYALGGREGALIGAATGAAGGFAYGTHIANKKARYASTEQWLDACIANANQTNQQARAKRSQLVAQLNELERRANRAVATNDKAEVRIVRTEIRQVKTQITEEVETLDKEHSTYSQVLDDPEARQSNRSGGLRSAVNQIDNTRTAYRGDLNRIADLNRSLDV